MRWLNRILGWVIGRLIVIWKWTCRKTRGADPRPELYVDGKGIAIAFLHAHQIAGLFLVDGPNRVAMISRSRDGDLITPAVKALGIGVARGSARTRKRDKGGRDALEALKQCVREGGTALFTVDGPQGPRNRVRRGIASLAKTEGVPIVPGIAVASRRRILNTWDRMQIPMPFSRVSIHWGEPILPEGKTNEEMRQATSDALRALELAHDPVEAARNDV